MSTDSDVGRTWAGLDVLGSFLTGHYHQDVWSGFPTHEAIWGDYARRAGELRALRLADQIEDLLARSPADLFAAVAWRLRGGGLHFAGADEAIAWLVRCRDFMRAFYSSGCEGAHHDEQAGEDHDE